MQAQHNVTTLDKERRSTPRFAAPKRALVALPGDALGLPYNMTDISEGGLSFVYIGNNSLSLTEGALDIYLNEDLQVAMLPVTVVADNQLAGYFIPKRRCSIRFGPLSEEQRQELRRFITRHATSVRADS